LLRKHPIQRFFESAENANSALTRGIPEALKHSSETVGEFVGYENSAARVRGENSALRHLANVLGAEVKLGNLRKIYELRVAGIKVRI